MSAVNAMCKRADQGPAPKSACPRNNGASGPPCAPAVRPKP